MRVLVVVASRHGSTEEIGSAVCEGLRRRGIDAQVSAPDAVHEPADYDGFVIGSAVYAGSWMSEAREFVQAHAELWADRPVWLFSSGPLADAEEPLSAAKLSELHEQTNALGHHVFSGRLDRHQLGVMERLLVRVVHAPDGDFRNWDEVAHWADRIADELVARAARPAGGLTSGA